MCSYCSCYGQLDVSNWTLSAGGNIITTCHWCLLQHRSSMFTTIDVLYSTDPQCSPPLMSSTAQILNVLHHWCPLQHRSSMFSTIDICYSTDPQFFPPLMSSTAQILNVLHHSCLSLHHWLVLHEYLLNIHTPSTTNILISQAECGW